MIIQKILGGYYGRVTINGDEFVVTSESRHEVVWNLMEFVNQYWSNYK